MLWRKLIELMLLTTCLSSCTVFDERVERCTINVVDKECYCHTYRIGQVAVGRVSDTSIYHLDDCDKLVGVSPSDWVKMYEALRRLAERSVRDGEVTIPTHAVESGFQNRD
jgi:hypothetical protein